MTTQTKSFKYTRKCDLNLIKECDVIFKTNRKNRRFCCDDHRYKWHNSMKAFFHRVKVLEKSFLAITGSFVNLVNVISESFGDPLKKLEPFIRKYNEENKRANLP